MVKKLKKRSYQRHNDDLPLPTDDKITKLSQLLIAQSKREYKATKYAHVKDVLTLLGVGTVLSLSLLSPTALLLAKPFLDVKEDREWDEWKQFNPSYLRRTIERMRQEKLVTVAQQDGKEVVELTKNGKRRILKFSLETLSVEKPRTWDRYWRLVLYDVSDKRKFLRDLFRQTLKTLGFYQLQESVWLYPYPCEPYIAFLREYYGVGNEVIYLIATKLEDDTPYRIYFGV